MPDREAFVEKLEARMHEWSARFEDLKARVRKVASTRRAEHAEQIAALQARRDEAKGKIRQLREAGGHAWEELREAAEKTWGRDVRRARRSRLPASCPLCVEGHGAEGRRAHVARRGELRRR
jgi:chromosome segregation ATPase